MKKQILQTAGGLYVVFAILMSQCFFTRLFYLEKASQRTESKLALENSAANHANTPNTGLEGATSSAGRLDRNTRYYYRQGDARNYRRGDARTHSPETISALAQEDRLKKLPPNCLIVWVATWCHNCKDMQPVIRELQEAGYSVHILDYDEYAALAKTWKIQAVPTSIVWNDRKEVARYIGPVTTEVVTRTLRKNDVPNYELW